MFRFMLDANVIIHAQRRQSPALLERFRSLRDGEAAVSVVVYGELCLGVERSRDPVRAALQLDDLFSSIAILPLTAACAVRYGAIRAQLQASGNTIGNNDLWIAAHALAEKLPLITDNEREFLRVPGLRIVNWTK